MIVCTFPDENKTANLRHVVVDVLAVKDNQILLIKRSNHLSGPNLWALPGGFLDKNETISHAALREFREETGYEGKTATLFKIIDSFARPGENQQNISFVYLVEVGEKAGEHDSDASEIKWFALKALPPENEIAFDHLKIIEVYKDSLQGKVNQEIFLSD